ncbi:hypothetical protein FBY05_101560 [Pseudomonas sp. SJZ083]|nr:hypothetical protein FBY05_101560 [Pseudomonas sp. SJZ083]TWC53965.1 hypothetical protein FBY01_101156 [Pseudomonas sp. SJZ077]
MYAVFGRNRQVRSVIGQVVNLCGHSAHHDVRLHLGVPVQD